MGELGSALFSLREKVLENLGDRGRAEVARSPFSTFASQMTATGGVKGLGSALFSLREKALVARGGIEPPTRGFSISCSGCNSMIHW